MGDRQVLSGKRLPPRRNIPAVRSRTRYRCPQPAAIATGGAIILSLMVTLAALTKPPSRAAVFRTDPVLQALAASARGPEAALPDLAVVPSLSVFARFVLPLFRAETKRVLMPEALLSRTESATGAPALSIDPRHLEDVGAWVRTHAEPADGKEPQRSQLADIPRQVVQQDRTPPPPFVTTSIATTVPAPPERRRAVSGARLAIVIDDLGPPRGLTQRALTLPTPITMALLPYADHLDGLVGAARARGHEIYLHLPMEPVGSEYPGPSAILVGLRPDELQRRLAWAFERVPLATGINNHMGSRATSDPATMLPVLGEVKRRSLSFVDSRTSPFSVADGLAARLGIPHAARDVFLDNEPSSNAVFAQLAAAERIARRRGQALAIGHPRPATLAALESWLPAARARGLTIIGASELIGHKPCPHMGVLQVSVCHGTGCAQRPSYC